MATHIPGAMEESKTAERAKALQTVDRNRALLQQAEAHAFAQTEQRRLFLHLFRPPEPATPPPVIVFFHGSMWERSLVSQFAPHAYYFAERGLATILAEFRVTEQDGTGPVEALEDMASLLRWLQKFGGQLGMDPSRHVLAGAVGGAWGALAWTLGLLVEHEDRPFILPQALVLFEPVVDLRPARRGHDAFPDKETAHEMDPWRLVKQVSKPPPAIFLHGTADAALPCNTTRKFSRRWEKRKGRADFVPFEGAGHGFYNFRHDMRLYESAVNAVDGFLVSLGLLGATDRLVTQ